MAITKYKVIKKNLDAVINYAMNGEKTENGILVSGINCLPQTAYSQMMLTKKVFHKEDARLGYHIIQSFNGNEISPDKCNKIGLELAQQLWGDKYQVIVCTHTNKKNIHNHIVLNSVSFIDGSKYHNSNVEIALLRQTNDDICRKHGLSIIKSAKATTVSDISKSRIANYNRNSGKMELIKADIDEAIKDAQKYQEFVDILNYKGYYIKKSGNYMSVSSPYYNRNIRLARAFGEDYTFDNIRTRIYQSAIYDRYFKKNDNEKVYKVRIYDGIKIDQEKLKTSSFYRLYVHYLYLLGKLPPKIHYEERTKQYYQEIDKFNKLADEMNLICTYNLNSKEDVKNLRLQYIQEVTPLKAQREKLRQDYKKANNADSIIIQSKIDTITEEIDKINKKIQTCKRIIFKAEKGENEATLIKNRVTENQQNNERENAKTKNKNKQINR